jgi:hypothetical protein
MAASALDHAKLRPQAFAIEGLSASSFGAPFSKITSGGNVSASPTSNALGDRGPSVRDREVDVAVGIMRRPPPGCWGRRVAPLRYAVFGTRAARFSDPSVFAEAPARSRGERGERLLSVV